MNVVLYIHQVAQKQQQMQIVQTLLCSFWVYLSYAVIHSVSRKPPNQSVQFKAQQIYC